MLGSESSTLISTIIFTLVKIRRRESLHDDGYSHKRELEMKRFLALDAFRGFTIAAMILVNTPGSWSAIYWPFQHSSWHGFTPTDAIFPFFLFIVGSAMYFSLAAQKEQTRTTLFIKACRRGSTIFLIGIALTTFPFTDAFEDVRLMGVLQRIGIVYIFASLMAIYLLPIQRLCVCIGILLVYWVMLYSLGGLDPYSLTDNIIAQIDLAVLGQSHMWHIAGQPFDPEGLLSSVPATVNVLVGYEATRYLTRLKQGRNGLSPLLAYGAALITLSLLWHNWLPINKSLWTSSFVIMSSGVSLITLALFIYVVDIKPQRWVSWPLCIYGTNPLFIYALSWIWAVSFRQLININTTNNTSISAYDWLYSQYTIIGEPFFASFVFALSHVVFFWLVCAVLHWRGIIIKI